MISLISKHRSSIMGFSIIWVMLFHFLTNQNFHGIVPIHFFSSIGYGGVDVFFFLSGLGLVYGYDKHKTPLQFYLRRFFRIYPTYIIVLFIKLYLVNEEPLTNVLIASTGIGFFLPYWNIRWFEWYVPTLFSFYILFPLIITSVKKYGIKSLIIWGLLGYVSTAILVFIQKGTIILATSRFPVFVLGIFSGIKLKWGGEMKIIWWVPLSVIVGFVEILLVGHIDDVFMWRSSLFWTPFILIAPGLCIGLAFLFEKSKILNGLFTHIGKRSLELYLVHISFGGYLLNPFLNLANKWALPINVWSSYLIFFIFFCSCYIVSVVLQLFSSKIDGFLTNYLRH